VLAPSSRTPAKACQGRRDGHDASEVASGTGQFAFSELMRYGLRPQQGRIAPTVRESSTTASRFRFKCDLNAGESDASLAGLS
jgi:hypothetical protein